MIGLHGWKFPGIALVLLVNFNEQKKVLSKLTFHSVYRKDLKYFPYESSHLVTIEKTSFWDGHKAHVFVLGHPERERERAYPFVRL